MAPPGFYGKLWMKMGSLLRTILRQKTLKKGTKKECSEFIDRPKKSYEKAEISNKSERRRKKPQKFDDYDFEDLTEQPTAKKPRPEFREFSLKNVHAEDLQMTGSDSEPFDQEAEEKAVLTNWQKKALSSKAAKKQITNSISRQNREGSRSEKT